MTKLIQTVFILCTLVFVTSCVSKKKFTALQGDLTSAQEMLKNANLTLGETEGKLEVCEEDRIRLKGELANSQNILTVRQEQMEDLNERIEDMKVQRDKSVEQVGDLTVLSKSANDNIGETLKQLEQKDQYIHLLQGAKNKADSINLALAVNLKGVLAQGIADDDIEIKVDKTVVMINLSDKMLFNSGSYSLSRRAKDVLSKIAKIVDSRPDYEVMVEGYTDSQPISTATVKDNWDLSVLRSTAVVRVLQDDYNIDPNRLIAAGRGEHNALADNATAEGRSTNRRTRIIIMPQIDQFYDLLNPDLAAGM